MIHALESDLVRLEEHDGEGAPDTALAVVAQRLYEQLHRIAEQQLRSERAGHTLQPTALVHEAYLRLLTQRDVDWGSPSAALGLAAATMRRVLVDHARSRAALKRGGGAGRITLSGVEGPSLEPGVDVLMLEEALRRLAEIDDFKAKIVELRFFGGLTTQQVSEVLNLPARSVDRKWAAARAWLFRELSR